MDGRIIIKTDTAEEGCEELNWFKVAQSRAFVNATMNFLFPL
jgi:hypothetical protein